MRQFYSLAPSLCSESLPPLFQSSVRMSNRGHGHPSMCSCSGAEIHPECCNSAIFLSFWNGFNGKIYSLKDITEVMAVRGAATTARKRNRSILLSLGFADGDNKKQKPCSQLKLTKFCNPHGKLRNTGMKCRTASCVHLFFNTLITCSNAIHGWSAGTEFP